MKKPASFVKPQILVASSALLICQFAYGFTFQEKRQIAVYENELGFYINLPGESDSGITWADAFYQASQAWVNATPVNIQVAIDDIDICTPQPASNRAGHVGFSPTLCSDDGEPAFALAQTRNGMRYRTDISESDIYRSTITFNSREDYRWDVYDGDLRTVATDRVDASGEVIREVVMDFRRAALHELGHSLGLGHSQFSRPVLSASANRDHNAYTLSVDDICGVNILHGRPEACPILLETPVTLSGKATTATFVGGASRDKGESFDSVFSPNDVIDIMATVVIEKEHYGRQGKLHTVVELSNGTTLMRTDTGFAPWDGSVEALKSVTSQTLEGAHEIYVLEDFDLAANHFSDIAVGVYIGYSLDDEPNEVYFSGNPIAFRIE